MLKSETEKRPNCPECGAPNPIKHSGISWWCKNCSRQWVRHPPRKVLKPLDRPSCPECKAPFPLSDGKRWVCAECGRYFKKIYHPRLPDFNLPNLTKLIKAKVIDI